MSPHHALGTIHKDSVTALSGACVAASHISGGHAALPVLHAFYLRLAHRLSYFLLLLVNLYHELVYIFWWRFHSDVLNATVWTSKDKMLTLRTLLSLPVLVSTTLIAHALASGDGFIDKNEKGAQRGDYAARLTGGEKCDDEEMKQIRDGFDEMNMIFQAAVRVDWAGQAELEFFGNRQRVQKYTSMIEANLVRAAQYANLRGNATRNPDIHVRCDDPNDMCDEGNKKDGKHMAYNIGNDPHIVFCKRYFNLDPMEETVDKEARNPQTNRDIMQYYTRGW